MHEHFSFIWSLGGASWGLVFFLLLKESLCEERWLSACFKDYSEGEEFILLQPPRPNSMAWGASTTETFSLVLLESEFKSSVPMGKLLVSRLHGSWLPLLCPPTERASSPLSLSLRTSSQSLPVHKQHPTSIIGLQGQQKCSIMADRTHGTVEGLKTVGAGIHRSPKPSLPKFQIFILIPQTELKGKARHQMWQIMTCYGFHCDGPSYTPEKYGEGGILRPIYRPQDWFISATYKSTCISVSKLLSFYRL